MRLNRFQRFLRQVKEALSHKAVAGGPLGDERLLTVSITNMTGYVSVVEQLSLATLPEFMNTYFALHTNLILETGGTLDKYVGDKIVAWWGTPIPSATHAQAACECALRQYESRDAFYAWARQHGYPCPSFRIGIHTDTMLVGNLGSRLRSNYTVVGRGMMVAQSLEQQARDMGVPILVSASTRAHTHGFAFGHAVNIASDHTVIGAYPLVGRTTASRRL
jgi:adenylate cyclase